MEGGDSNPTHRFPLGLHRVGERRVEEGGELLLGLPLRLDLRRQLLLPVAPTLGDGIELQVKLAVAGFGAILQDNQLILQRDLLTLDLVLCFPGRDGDEREVVVRLACRLRQVSR